MPRVKVPRQHVEPLRLLAKLPAETFEQLLRALEPQDAMLSRSTLQRQIASVLGDRHADDARQLVSALISSGSARVYNSWSAGDMAQSIADSRELQEIPEEERATLVERLERILDSRSVIAIASAGAVLADHERVFLQARILTDIRPVFYGDTEVPNGAVVVYTLRVDSHRAGHDESLSFALDDSDLLELKEVVDRAVHESSGVKDLLNSTGLIAYSPLNEKEE